MIVTIKPRYEKKKKTKTQETTFMINWSEEVPSHSNKLL